jgi:chromosomal replication initiation ATPase DnaA
MTVNIILALMKEQQTIDFGDGDGVTLFWGDNGHGKTHLLTSFVCLVWTISVPP